MSNDCGNNSNSFIVTEEYEGERLDKLLAVILPDYSRSYLQQVLKDGNVLLNGRTVKASAKVKEGDLVAFAVPEKVIPDIAAEDIPLDILYEDDDVLVVNKPKNMVVHPAPGHYTGTLVNAVMYHCRDNLSGINGVLRPGIVHRIDKDTTGSVIICKNDLAHRSIAQQLKDHTIVRRYVAILYGDPFSDPGVSKRKGVSCADGILTVDAAIGRDPADRRRNHIDPDGKRAVTHIRLLEKYKDYTYAECRLETGRTHQIRVHTQYIGHPILGDDVYAPGRKPPFRLEGQCLHAMILGFVHPRSGEYIETTAPVPEYMDKLLRIMPK